MPGRGGAGPGGCLVPGGCLLLGGCPLRGVLVIGGCLLWVGVPGGDPPGQPLLRAVHILLECIIVYDVGRREDKSIEEAECLPQR